MAERASVLASAADHRTGALSQGFGMLRVLAESYADGASTTTIVRPGVGPYSMHPTAQVHVAPADMFSEVNRAPIRTM